MFALFALYLHYFALCLHCICTAALCVAPVVPFPLCTALGWAGLGWLGWGQCPVSPRGQLQPGGDMAGQTRGLMHYTLHTTHARQWQCHDGKKDGMSMQQSVYHVPCHGAALLWCCARCSVRNFILSTLLFSGYCFVVVDAC